MEALATTGSVIAVIQITGTIAKLCSGYISQVKNARRDIELLQEKLIAFEGVMQRFKEQSTLRSTGIETSLSKCIADLQTLEDKIQPKHALFQKLGRRLKWPLSKDETYRELARLEGYLTIFNLDAQLDNLDLSREIRDNQALKDLTYVGAALYTSHENERRRHCLDGTRVEIIDQILEWAKSDTTQQTFWLKGQAGTGKSTLALTIANRLDTQGKAVATFFFQRGNGELSTARRVVSTIVFQFAILSNTFRDKAAEVVKKDPTLDSASIGVQFRKLLLDPLLEIKSEARTFPRIVIIIDALDECDDTNAMRLLIRLFGQSSELCTMGIRLLLTSRPESVIQLGFNELTTIRYHELALHHINRDIVEQDLRAFISHELETIRNERRLPMDWPEAEKVGTLTNRAGGLFIYAATVCRYINSSQHISPSQRLNQVCALTTTKHKATDALDDMYTFVLSRSIQGDLEANEENLVTSLLRRILGSIVLLFRALTTDQLQTLILPVPEYEDVSVRTFMTSLHSIIDVPDDVDMPIRMLHLSLGDFLLDPARCVDHRFHVPSREGHHRLFLSCLNLMQSHLAENMCQLSDDCTSVNEVPKDQLKQTYPPALRYACRYWIDHAEAARLNDDDEKLLYTFLRTYLLWWLEAMGFLRQIPEATIALRKLKKLVSNSNRTSLNVIAEDALQFALYFGTLLSRAPLHLHTAGATFAPSSSPIRDLLHKKPRKHTEVLTTLPEGWDACIQRLEPQRASGIGIGHDDFVNKLQYSCDGSKIAAIYFLSNHIFVWDVQTGECVAEISAPGDRNFDALFLPDLSALISIVDDQGHCLDLSSGSESWMPTDPSDQVTAICLSPDGHEIACGYSNGNITIFSTQNVPKFRILNDKVQPAVIQKLSFCPEQKYLLALSTDGVCNIWDRYTGRLHHQISFSATRYNVGLTSKGRAFLASCNDDDDIREEAYQKLVTIWDIENGCQLRTLEHPPHCDLHVTFSNSRPLMATTVSASNVSAYVMSELRLSPQFNIRRAPSVWLWDVLDGTHMYTFDGYSTSMNLSATFSPDGYTLAVAAPDDKIVQFFDLSSGVEHSRIDPCTNFRSILFSADSKSVAHASTNDDTITIWDLTQLHSHAQTSNDSNTDYELTASLDGTRLAMTELMGTSVMIFDSRGRKVQTLTSHGDRHAPSEDFITPVISSPETVFSPDGTMVAAVLGNPQACSIWDVVNGHLLHTLPNPYHVLSGMFFSADNSRMIVNSQLGDAELWELPEGKLLPLELGGERIVEVVYLPSGAEFVFALTSGQIIVTKGDSKREVGKIPLDSDSPNVRMAVTDDGIRLAVVCGNISIDDYFYSTYIWNLKSRTLETMLANSGPREPVLSFSSDGETLLYRTQYANETFGWNFTTAAATIEVDKTQLRGSIFVTTDGWILYQRRRILWLPPDYRPICKLRNEESSAIRQNQLYIITKSGRLAIVRLFEGDQTSTS